MSNTPDIVERFEAAITSYVMAVRHEPDAGKVVTKREEVNALRAELNQQLTGLRLANSHVVTLAWEVKAWRGGKNEGRLAYLKRIRLACLATDASASLTYSSALPTKDVEHPCRICGAEMELQDEEPDVNLAHQWNCTNDKCQHVEPYEHDGEPT